MLAGAFCYLVGMMNNEKSRILRFIASHKRAVRQAKSMSIGCMQGFRKAAKFSSKAELAALQVGEDAALYHAIIHNGAHPDYQNGKGLLPKYRRMLDARRAA